MHSRRTDGFWSSAVALALGVALAGMTATAANQDPSPSQPAAEQQLPAPSEPAAEPQSPAPAQPPAPPAQPPQEPPAAQPEPPAAPQSEQAPAPEAQAQGSVAPAAVSDEELEKFVRSVAQVNELQTALKEKLPTLQGAEAESVQQESNAEMARIIQGCDLEVERYNELARVVSTSPELSQRFQAKQQELASRGNVPPCVADAAPEAR
jgi:outer membrane biosynthesis protein TonB